MEEFGFEKSLKRDRKTETFHGSFNNKKTKSFNEKNVFRFIENEKFFKKAKEKNDKTEKKNIQILLENHVYGPNNKKSNLGELSVKLNSVSKLLKADKKTISTENKNKTNNIERIIKTEENEILKESNHDNLFSKINYQFQKNTENISSKAKNLINTKINQFLNKREKCCCDFNLKFNENCSNSMKWLNRKYNKNDLKYLKNTYKKLKLMNENTENNFSFFNTNFNYTSQIEKDLYRTYPQCKFFSKDSEGIKQLKNILLTFAKYDPKIDLPGLSKHCQIIDFLIFNHLPKLYSHLVEIFCSPWIFSLFGLVIPLKINNIFYSKLFEEGWPFLYKLILVFLMQLKTDIINNDTTEILILLTKYNNCQIIKDKKKQIDWLELINKTSEININTRFISKMHAVFDEEKKMFYYTLNK